MVKKIISIILCSLITLTTLGTAGCRTPEGGKKIDPNKTQLYVGNYYGALGNEWYNNIIERFEADNPTIQVWIDDETDVYNDANLINRLGSGTRQDIYFQNGITYNTYANSGKLADLTELVTTPMNELFVSEGEEPIFSETYTIAENMNDTLADYYKTADGKYYAIPFYEAIFGLIYDIDLFEQKKLYFRKGYEDSEIADNCFITSLKQEKALGPDGKPETYDDGLPATYSQFKKLITVMKGRGVTPFIWNKHINYRQRYLMSIWADYEGKSNFDLNNSFDGYYTFNGDSEPTKITESNADLLMYQKGHEYALQFAYDIVSDPDNYYSLSFDPSNSQGAAQDVYLDSRRKNSPIGMIMEANWFENEASGTFGDMATTYGEQWSKGTRRFGFMPVPKADDGSSATGTTLLGVSGHSVAVIDNESPNKEIAMKFLAYCQTQAGLADFTASTGVLRPFEYTLSDSQWNGLTELAKITWTMYKDENIDVCYNNIYTSKFKLDNSANYTFWGWQTDVNGIEYNEPFDTFFSKTDLTVSQYLEGTKTWASGYVKK